MSKADLKPSASEVPSTARLAWLVFMQPLRLEKLLERRGMSPPVLSWSRRRKLHDDPHARRLIGQLLWLLLVWGPVVTLIAGLLPGLSPTWSKVIVLALGFIMGVSLGAFMGIGTALNITMSFGLSFGLSFGATCGFLGEFDGTYTIIGDRKYGFLDLPTVRVALSVAFSTSFGMAYGVVLLLRTKRRDVSRRFVIASVTTAFLIAVLGTVMGGRSGGIASTLAFLIWLTRLHFFPFEAIITGYIAAVAHDPERGPRAALWLPYRHHELIHFPLPWLRHTLIALAEHSPNLARQLIDEASTSGAQKGPAQRAFDELQARAVRQAADVGAWLRVIELRGSFFPAKDTLPPDDPLIMFIAAATDLHAVESGGSQHRRRNLLEKAGKQVEDIKKSYLAAPAHEPRGTLLYDAAGAWSRAIAVKREALTREIEQNPEIPNVYVVGPSLNPGDPEALQLFRARRDLITIIERDLDDTQRGVIFLVGQRRMGKTSLLAMLPTYLGTATTIITCDFQGLSGSEHGGAPHRWVVQELAVALARVPGLSLPDPVVTDAWGSALAWLVLVDAELARLDHRALVAVDEVERLQDAVNQGWGSLTFLDFVRATGDKLRRIRLLLVSAHPLANPKLGRAWVDRLISVLPRTLGPLDPEDAEALLCRPVPTFPPDVYGEEAARTILTHTGRHPFLIQAVGKEIVQRLLKDRRRNATALDVERAFDGVVKIAESALFTYLWDAFEPAERDIMRALAGGASVDPDTGTFRVLREQSFVDLQDGDPAVAFPLFGRWIRDYRGERPESP